MLYRAHGRSLLAYALRRVERAEDAADVVAESMLVAWRRPDAVPHGDEARLWLFGVAHRVLANHRRGEHRRDRLGDRLRDDLRRLVTLDLVADVDTNLTVQAALDALDDDDRELLHLTAWEGLEPQEIARVMSIPAATARSRLHRARRRLRRRLDQADAGSDERPAVAGHVDDDGRRLVGDAEEER